MSTGRWLAPAHRIGVGLVPLSLVLLSGCGDDGPTTPQINGRPIYAVTFDNRFLLFGSAAPATIVEETPISGLPAGERIVAIDFRPDNGLLYGAGTDDRLYTIDLETAAATPVAQTPFTTTLDGEHFGLDFNPTVDLLRLSSVETEQNLRVDPETGTVAALDVVYAYAAGDLNAGVNPAVGGLAYTNSVAGATTTVLYAIDSNTNSLVSLLNPNSGEMTTVGELGVNTVPCIGFDIDPADGTAFATLAEGGITSLYTINLSTGAATGIGAVDVDSEVQGIAVGS